MNKTDLVNLALVEDMPKGDLTTEALFEDQVVVAKIKCKQKGILAGSEMFELTMKTVDSEIDIKWNTKDGQLMKDGDIIGVISGNVKSILKAERVSLNFLQHLSAIATKTRAFVNETVGTNAKILDTRKTLPGYRALQKEAVVTGGGVNHRFSLSDVIMIKDNHISAAGSIDEAINQINKKYNQKYQVIVECDTLVQVKAATVSKCDIILFDNMNLEQMRDAQKIVSKRKITEASGNMDLQRIKDVAQLGVDRISIGELTHSVSAQDISLDFEGEK